MHPNNSISSLIFLARYDHNKRLPFKEVFDQLQFSDNQKARKIYGNGSNEYVEVGPGTESIRSQYRIYGFLKGKIVPRYRN